MIMLLCYYSIHHRVQMKEAIGTMCVMMTEVRVLVTSIDVVVIVIIEIKNNSRIMLQNDVFTGITFNLQFDIVCSNLHRLILVLFYLTKQALNPL